MSAKYLETEAIYAVFWFASINKNNKNEIKKFTIVSYNNIISTQVILNQGHSYKI